ncbi:MAG TPA: hypothetical protein VF483_07455 [Gemmatimonadaceae bacterium]
MRLDRVLRLPLAALCAIAGIATRALAQELESPVLFLERAYFTPASPFGKKLVFEGQPTAHYFLFNTFGDSAWQAHGGLGIAAPVSELFVVRMSGSASTPVLTPSYHIGLRLQLAYLWHDTVNVLPFRMLHVMTGVMHYSNGQNGCTYLGFTRSVTAGTCAPGPTAADSALAARSLANTVSGDFSTSYIPFGVDFRWGQLIPKTNTLKSQVTLGAQLQIHPLRGLPGAPEPQQIAQYAKNEWSASGEWECRNQAQSGVWRLAGSSTTRFGGGAQSFSRGAAEVSYIFEGARVHAVRFFGVPVTPPIHLHHAGFVARFNTGYDYYNIHFQERGNFWSLGILLDPGRLDGLNEHKDARAGNYSVGNCLPW